MTTRKHRSFIMEPIGIKKVTEIAGIGAVYGEKLKKSGFEYAYIL